MRVRLSQSLVYAGRGFGPGQQASAEDVPLVVLESWIAAGFAVVVEVEAGTEDSAEVSGSDEAGTGEDSTEQVPQPKRRRSRPRKPKTS